MKRAAVSMMLLALVCGCRSTSIQEDIAAYTGAAVRGMRDTLTNDQSRRMFASLVDTLVRQAGSGLARQTGALRDTLLGAGTLAFVEELKRSMFAELRGTTGALRDTMLGLRTRLLLGALRDDLLGARTRGSVAALRDELLGTATAKHLAALRDTLFGGVVLGRIGALRDDLLGDATSKRLAALRSELVGDSTQRALDSIVARSLKRLQDAAEGQRSGLAGDVTAILWTAGGIVALLLVLAGIIFLRNRRYRKMLSAVATQIDDMPDRGAYAELTGRIESKSRQMGVEPHLRKFMERKR